MGQNPGAALIAVYRYLRLCGCRWLFPGEDGEWIPVLDALPPAGYRRTAEHRHRGQCGEGAEGQRAMPETIETAVCWNSTFPSIIMTTAVPIIRTLAARGAGFHAHGGAVEAPMRNGNRPARAALSRHGARLEDRRKRVPSRRKSTVGASMPAAYFSGRESADPARGAMYNPSMAKTLRIVPAWVDAFRPVIRAHLGQEMRASDVSRRMLSAHADLASGFALAAAKTADGEDASEAFRALRDDFSGREIDMERSCDHLLFRRAWEGVSPIGD